MRRTAVRVLGAFALFLSGQTLAQDYRYHVFIDRDVRNDTGCSQVVGAETISGAEERLTANITGTSVTSVTRATCSGGSFGAEQGIGGPHPVGLNNGTAAGDVIELAVGRDALGVNGAARVAVSGENGTGTAADVLSTQAGGGPIFIDLFRAAIPTLGMFGLLLLVGALLFVASRKLKFGLASIGALLVAGAVWAANFVTDGQVGDWAGQSALATDPNGDASGTDPGAELLAFYGAEENGRVFFRIDVEDVENQVPVPQAQNLTFAEDSGAQPITLVATDGDGDPITYAIAANPAKGVLSGFNAATGAVTYTPNANAEGADSFSFTASDGLATSAPATISITLTPANDAPVAQDATFSVPENSANATLVGTPVVATDVDTTAPNNTLSYAITAGNTAGAFAINASTGQISVANSAALDFKTNPSFSLTVTVTDGGAGPLSDTATVTINLGNLNEPPVFQGEPYVFSLAENSVATTVVGSVPALDQDTTAPNNTLTYAITSGNGAGAFAINGATGQITVANSTPLNFEATTSFTLGVSVSDGGTPQGSDTSSVTINLTDVNEAPTVTGGTFTLPENSANGTAVGSASATDPDVPAQTFTWAITAGNTGGAFAINPANGAITVATTAAVDFETNPTFALTVQATDNGAPAQSGTATVTVNLTNVNEAPVYVGAPYTTSVQENSANGTTVFTVTANDVDAGSVLTHSITGATVAGAFAINASTGEITVANSAALDTKTNPSITVNVQVTDNGAPTLNAATTVAITVGDVNEAPVFQSEPYAFSIAENVAVGTAVGSVPALDQDLPAQTLTYSITSGNGAGVFAINPATGAITVAVPPDFETAASYSLGVSVSDGGLGDTSTVAVTITNVNEAPVNMVPAGPLATGVSVPLAFTGPNSISVADVDAGAGNITTTVSTTLGTFTATAQNGAVVSGSGSNSVSITDIVADVNATLQTLSFSSAAGGTGTITVATNDGGNTGSGGPQTDTDLIAINVDAAPAVLSTTPGEGAVVPNNQALVINFTEQVDVGAGISLTCSAGPVALSNATGSNVASVSPTYAGSLPSGACSLNVPAAAITDVDAIDPPDQMAAPFTLNFTVDAAPAVTTTTPANGDGNVAANATITVNFSELVDIASAAAFSLECNAVPLGFTVTSPATLPASTTSVTIAPAGALPDTSTCVFTVFAASVPDSDVIDQPDTMLANHVVNFTTTDPAPAVTTTNPPDSGSASAAGNIVVNFSENVNFSTSSFTINCGGAQAFSVSGSGSNQAVLDPTANLPLGGCTVTVLSSAANGPTDVDTIDPPDALAAPFVFAFTATNAPPVLTAGATLNFSEGSAAAVIDNTMTVADPDTTSLAGATAQITGGYVNGEDVLSFTNTPNITGTFTPATGMLTLSGTDTLANYQAALRAVRYDNSSDTPSTAARTVSWIGNDGIANSVAVTSTINVSATDDGPTAVADSATVLEDSGANAIDVLANDTDVDGGSISITAVTQPANGTVVITGGGTGLTYAPSANYCNTPPGTTLDTFTYTLTPGGSTTTVTVTVTCVDDNPTAVADAATVNEDSSASAVNVLANDNDADGGPISVNSVTQPANGTVVITGGGTGLTYQPNPNYCNNPPGVTLDTFTYTVTPGGSAAIVTMTVTCVDDPPVAVADSATVTEDSGANAIIVLANDTDPDAGPKSVQSVTQPANGTVVVTGGGTGLTYAPNANYCNTPPGTTLDTFTYTLTPGGSSTTVTMTVTCVNDAPVADNDTFDFLGNTDLVVDLAALATPHALETTGTTLGVIDGDSDPVEGDSFSVSAITVGGCTDFSSPLDCSDPAVGRVQMQANGRFQFTPAPGDTGATETFQYTITDTGVPTAASTTATVTLTRFERIWYVNAGAAAGNGTASSPLNSLTAINGAGGAGDGDQSGDYIFVHNSGSALSGGLELEANQRLLGEAAGLSVPVNLNGNGSPTNLVAAGPTRPQWNNSGGNTVSMSCAMPVEIRGLSLNSTSGNAIDLTCAAALTGSTTLAMSGNDFRGASAEGVDLNLNGGSTGTLALTFTNNNWVAGTHTGNAFDLTNANTVTLGIDFSNNTNIVSNAAGVSINDTLPGGVTTITGFANNTVSGDTGGAGIFVNNAVFDTAAGAPFGTVSAGTTAVGASGNGVGTSGMVLTAVTGDLSFADLDIFNSNGVGLRATSSNAFNAASGLGFRLAVASGVGTVSSIGGPVIDFDSATIDLQSATITGSGSTTQGLRFNSALGNFSAGSSSSLSTSNAAATAFSANGSVINSTFGGSITTTAGKGVELTGNTGSTFAFTGALSLTTGTNPAFAATGGGTVTANNAANVLTTTTGTALNVANTTIGASGLTFRSIASSGAANGIVLNNTGAGNLTVTGTGGAGTGGTIQATTGDAISLATVGGVTSLSGMIIQNNLGNGIRGDGIGGLNLTTVSVINNADNDAIDEAGIHLTNLRGTSTWTSIVVADSLEDNARILNNGTNTLAQLTITNSVFRDTTAASPGNNGLLIQGDGSANMTVDISSTQFLRNRANGLQVINNGTGAVDVELGTSTGGSGGAHADNNITTNVAHNGPSPGALNFDVRNLSVVHAVTAPTYASPINLNLGGVSTAGSVMQGFVQSSTVDNNDSPTGPGIRITSNGGGTMTVRPEDNTITEHGNRGIEVIARDGSSRINATVHGNNINLANPLSADALHVSSGAVSTDTTTICLDLNGDNNAADRNTLISSALNGARVRQRFAGTFFELEDYAGVANDIAAVQNFLQARNLGGDTFVADFGGAGFAPAPGADCANPL